jgi:hypothetical protein
MVCVNSRAAITWSGNDTLVFIMASTGIQQSELFALKWGDIDLSAGTMNRFLANLQPSQQSSDFTGC